MDVDRPQDARRLTQAWFRDWWPAWCGSEFIAFERGGDPFVSGQAQDIGLVRVDGSSDVDMFTSSNLPEGSDMNGVPSCSPDGDYLAFSSRASGAAANDFKIGLVDLMNPPYKFNLLGDGYGLGGRVSWSPHSDEVVFFHNSEDDEGFQIFRADPARPSGAVDLTSGFEGSHKYPDWSPRGDLVTFACNRSSGSGLVWGLCTVSPSGRDVTMVLDRLHEGDEIDYGLRIVHHAITPSFSPDGGWIAFASDMDGSWDIYIYELSTRKMTKLTEGWPSNEMHPAWGPR